MPLGEVPCFLLPVHPGLKITETLHHKEIPKGVVENCLSLPGDGVTIKFLLLESYQSLGGFGSCLHLDGIPQADVLPLSQPH